MRYLVRTFSLISAAAPLACSGGDPVDIGDNARVGSELTDYAANWDGYGEAYLFDRDSDRIRLTLDGSGEGTIRFGEGELFPSPTDPNIGYPVDDNPYGQERDESITHFVYGVSGASVDDARLRFDFNVNELYRAWCELQTSYQHPPSSFGCLPPADGFHAESGVCYRELDGEDFPVDCGKRELCGTVGGVCDCEESGCTAKHIASTLRARPPVKPAFWRGLAENRSGTYSGI